MNYKEKGCLVCVAVTAVLAVGAAWISTATGDGDNVNADLIMAAKVGNAAEVKSLLDRGADPNAREVVTPDAPPVGVLGRIAHLFRSHNSTGETGDSALTDAVHNLHPYETASVLIQHGAKADTGLLGGAENVHYAARAGDSATVILLIEYGASVKMPPNHFADLRLDMLMLLAAHGAAVPPPADARHGRSNPGCYGIPLSDRDREFLAAINRDDISAVRRLLAAGEDYYLADNNETSALDIAAYKGFRDLLELFVEHGANINDAYNNRSWSPLLYALENRANVPRRLATIRFLLDHGANANAVDSHRISAMKLVKSGKLDHSAAILTLLKAHGGSDKPVQKRRSGMGMSNL
jgi:ankyrin repeat protein